MLVELGSLRDDVFSGSDSEPQESSKTQGRSMK